MQIAALIAIAALGQQGVPHETPSTSQPRPMSAPTVVNRALAEAKSSGRSVMVIFHASWCGWCKRLDAFMAKPEFKPIFDRYFVVTHLDVLERDADNWRENAGGEELLKKWGGDGQGIPYTVILNPENRVLADSRMPGKDKSNNTGYPAAPEEIDWFMKMLGKGVKPMSAADAKTLSDGFKANAPK